MKDDSRIVDLDMTPQEAKVKEVDDYSDSLGAKYNWTISD